MILPFSKDASGSWHFSGYKGLASHGGIIGVLIAAYIFVRKKKPSYLWLLDRIAIAGALAGCFIRIGNFFNSEIIGTPSDLPWAIVFERVSTVPRHPAQLYEAAAYLAIFGVLIYLYTRKRTRLKDGFILGLFLVLLFTARFSSSS
jgi:prolipoprotein diacylglyceryl transferase